MSARSITAAVRVATLAVALVLPGAVAAAEPPPLGEVEHVTSRLLAAAIGDQIRRNCPEISDRRWVVRSEALRLYNHALSLGHSRRSVEAFLSDPAERATMEARRDAWLRANGAAPGNAESYCRIGRREIAQGTYIGSLLRID
ncbi:MAG: DUF5333 domain-containing protein [Alkalilacustris sp.]